MEAAATQTDTTAAGGAGRSRWRTAAFALAVLLLLAVPGPVLVAAMFTAGVNVLAIPVVYGLRRERFGRHLRKAAFRVAFLLLAGVLVGVNFHLAEARLGRVVEAMHAYHDVHGAYPDDLAALVPGHLERVPRATLWLTMNRFRWSPNGLLTCVPTPPIGWIGHDFRTDAPAALD